MTYSLEVTLMLVYPFLLMYLTIAAISQYPPLCQGQHLWYMSSRGESREGRSGKIGHIYSFV